MRKTAIGADIGGTHISAAVIDLTTGTPLPGSLFRNTYDHQQAAETILDAWAEVLQSCLQIAGEDCQGIGMAIPGPFDYRNGISNMQHKFPQLFHCNVHTELVNRLNTGQLPLRFMNDATAFAVGEAWVGAGQSFSKVVVVTLGTGFGSAFLENGIPVVHSDTVPKEGCLWHVPFKEGIADDYFSTRWLVAAYEAKKGIRLEGAQPLAALAEKDPEVQIIFKKFGVNLGLCLEHPLRRFGAECLIMGGNIAHASAFFQPAFESTLYSLGYSIPIFSSKLWEEAALIGSARLLDPLFWEKVSIDFPDL